MSLVFRLDKIKESTSQKFLRTVIDNTRRLSYSNRGHESGAERIHAYF